MSTRSRRSDASHAARMEARSRRQSGAGDVGGLVRAAATGDCGQYPATFVATTRLSRWSRFFSSQAPRISSVVPGRQPGAVAGTGYISAASMKLIPRSLTA